MKEPPKQSRWICMIIAVMAVVIFSGTMIFISIVTHIPFIRIRAFICTCYILFTFYYIARNINKILYE